jgi:RNA polymerase sigma-70 factor (ECF subfamily)
VRRSNTAEPTTPVASDPRGFEAVYLANHDFVRRTICAMGVPDHAADDVTQDVFVVVHRRMSSLDPDASVRAWLFGIIRNLTRRRGEKLGRRAHLSLVRESTRPVEPVPPDEAVQWREAAGVVAAFLETLDADKRAVFVLAELEGLSAPEIAQALGVKLNTVYSRLRGARLRFERTVARAEARANGKRGGRGRGA